MNAPIVSGHGLLFEGRPVESAHTDLPSYWGEFTTDGQRFVLAAGSPRVGIAACRCGETSEVLPSTASRQRWHKTHKNALVAES